MRLEQADFDLVANESVRRATDQIVDVLMLGEGVDAGGGTNARGYVISGFTITNPTGTVISVTNGTAIVGYRDSRGLQYGCVIGTDTSASRSLDIGAYSNATYGVWIRGVYKQTDNAVRKFWDPLAATPTEVSRSVYTRYTEDWALALEVSSPGPEWVRVGTVTKVGATLTPSTAGKDLFFEGASESLWSPTADWGSTDDRNNNRNTYGLRGFRQFVRAVQAQLDAIIGANWWSALTSIQSLTTLTSGKLERNGSNTITGDITPNANNTRSFGSSLLRFANIFTTDLDVSDDLTVTDDATIGGDTTTTNLAVNATANIATLNVSGASSLTLAPQVAASGPTANRASYNSVYRDDVAKARIRLDITGAPGVIYNSTTCQNIDFIIRASFASSPGAATDVRIAFGTPMATDTYNVQVTPFYNGRAGWDPMAIVAVMVQTVDYFDIRVYDANTGVVDDAWATTNSYGLAITVIG